LSLVLQPHLSHRSAKAEENHVIKKKKQKKQQTRKNYISAVHKVTVSFHGYSGTLGAEMRRWGSP
jgi:hypothetical protein